jgi:hypothetical protein
MTQPHPEQSFGLHRLRDVPLLPVQDRALERMRQVSLGSPIWRARKEAEVRELFALENIASRMTIAAIDPTTELLVAIRLEAKVATLPPDASELVIESEVELALRYPEEILRGPLPGPALVHIVSPRHVHHANVGSIHGMQPLCLGVNIPRGFPLREAILASYAALTMQAVTIDEQDPAGVMRADAARFWQSNSELIPLSREPFLVRGEP